MTKTIYTLVAHRESGHHNRTGSSPAKLVQKVFEDRRELIAFAGRLQFDNALEGRVDWGVNDFEFTIYLNGVDRSNWWHVYPYAEDVDGIAEAGDDDLAAIEEEIEAERRRLVAEDEAREAAAAAQRRLDDAAAAERNRLADEQRERDLLVSLIEKHGMPNAQGKE